MPAVLALILTSTLGAPCLASETWAGPAPQQSQAAETAPQSPFAALIAEYLRRDANGHSPNPDEIAAMATLQPQPDPASIREAMPWLLKALENPDIPLHTFALNALIGLQTAPPAPPPEPPAPPDPNAPPNAAPAQPT